MIQRIQSLYLLLAAIAASVMFFFPLAVFYGDHNFQMYVYQLSFFDPNPSLNVSDFFLLPLLGMVILIIFLSILSLLSFKNRKRQLTLVKVNMAFTLILLAGFFLGYMRLLEGYVGNAPEYQFASFMPILVFLFLVLANRGVQKDEKLIRSMDRLR
jgi:glucan phosphoethanolaminetransferase (alkaline phosphatase superfamily)